MMIKKKWLLTSVKETWVGNSKTENCKAEKRNGTLYKHSLSFIYQTLVWKKGYKVIGSIDEKHLQSDTKSQKRK